MYENMKYFNISRTSKCHNEKNLQRLASLVESCILENFSTGMILDLFYDIALC